MGVIIYLETLWIDNPTGSFTSAFGMYLIRILLHNSVRRFAFDLSHRIEYGMVGRILIGKVQRSSDNSTNNS